MEKKLENIPALWIRNLKKIVPGKLPKEKRGLKFKILDLQIEGDKWTAQLLLQDKSKIKIKGTEDIK
tara:strand:+ start:1518 stop:1718 length:201 start_codon:yes stop_codon:yes gene_type:complete